MSSTPPILLETGGTIVLEPGNVGNVLLEAGAQPATMRVQAVSVGQYGGITRNIGDVFDIIWPGQYANYQLDYLNGGEGAPYLGWMMILANQQTPLQANVPTPLSNPAFNGTVNNSITGSYPRLVY